MNPVAMIFYAILFLAAILVTPWFLAVAFGALVALEIVDPVMAKRRR